MIRLAVRPLRALGAVGMAAAFVSCLSPYEERTDADRGVGRATHGDLSIAIDGGLGAVRLLDRGQLGIWAQAPELQIHLSRESPQPEDWTIGIDNCLADADLTATGKGGLLAVTSGAGGAPTRKRWHVALGSEKDVSLALRAPDRDGLGSFRFGFLSDVQEAIDRVESIYAKMNDDPSLRFVLSGGDLTDGGTAEEMAQFQDKLGVLRVPFYAAPGNHDIAASQTLFRTVFGRGNFHFTYRGIAFTALDSASATIDPNVYDWLDGWLGDAGSGVHVVTMHIPPLDPVGGRNAAFASRFEAAKLLTRLARGGVDLTLYGHIHSYYAFANGGIPAYISGGGGAHPERFDGIGRHYLTVDVGANGELTTGLVRIDGD